MTSSIKFRPLAQIFFSLVGLSIESIVLTVKGLVRQIQLAVNEDQVASMAVREVGKLEKKVEASASKKELKHISKKKAADREEEKRQKLVTIIAESDDSSVQDEFRRRLIQLDAQHEAEKKAASLRAALQKHRGTRKRTASALADCPSFSSVSGSVTPSSGHKEVEIVEIEQANPKDGSKPCKRTATCKAADFLKVAN